MTALERIAVKVQRQSAGSQYVYIVVNGVVEMIRK